MDFEAAHKTNMVRFNFTEAIWPETAKLLKIYPDLTMWRVVKINCRSAATLQMSLCLPRSISPPFSHTVCAPFAPHLLWFIAVNEHLLQNQFQHILKYSYCTKCPVNKERCFEKPNCYCSLYLHPLSIEIKVWITCFLSLHVWCSHLE